MGLPLLPLGVVPSAIAFVLYMFAAGIAVALVAQRHANRTLNAIVDDFYRYVAKGRKRVARIRMHAGTLFGIQILFLGLAFYLGFLSYFVATLVLFYGIALYKDRMKKHRHNGVPIGYEYPHPANIKEERALMTQEGRERVTPRIIEAGSKGFYDIPILSEPNPHVAVIGESGSGKSSTVEAFLLGAYRRHRIPFLIIDWSGSYKSFDGYLNLWRVPENLKVDPLALRGKEPERRAGIASEVLQFSLGLTDLQAQKARELLLEAYASGSEPTLQELWRRTKEEEEAEHLREIKANLRYLANRLRQAFEVFGSEPIEFWDNYDRTCNVIELEGLTDAEKNLVTQSILQRVIENFRTVEGVRLYIALDDAYQAIRNWEGRETPITRIVREGRKYGFGLVISTQMLRDLPDPIIGNTAVKFIGSYHEPDGAARISRMLGLTELEQQILYRMPVGHCFLFDQDAVQHGKAYPAFVQVDRTTRGDKEELRDSIRGLDIGTAKPPAREPRVPTKGVHRTIREMDIPSVSVYRFLIALSRSQGLTDAYRMLKSRKWITSKTTLYGTKSKPSLLQRATDSGYIKDGKLTQRAIDMIDPELLVDKQGVNKGSSEHMGLMRNTISAIQDRGNFAFVLDGREVFDVGEVRVDAKIKGMWNYKDVVAYEIQMNAIRSEIDRCVQKAKEQDAELVFVTNGDLVKDEIKSMTGNKYQCIKLPIK